jgi:hypothetical protein
LQIIKSFSFLPMGPVRDLPGLAFKTPSLLHALTTVLQTSTTVVEVLLKGHVASLALTAWEPMVVILLRNSAVLLATQTGAVWKIPRVVLPESVSGTRYSFAKRSNILSKGQINVCIATQPDTISGVSQYLLNETFSSLSSATPAGITYAFDATSLSAVALATSLSTSSSTIVSDQPPPSSLSSSPTPIPTKSSSSSDTVSGGTIAGAVVGCVVGIAAILIIGYIVLRRCPRGKLQKEEVGHVSKQLWEERKTHSGIHNMSELPNSSAPAEMGGVYEAHELPGRKLASELPT